MSQVIALPLHRTRPVASVAQRPVREEFPRLVAIARRRRAANAIDVGAFLVLFSGLAAAVAALV